tara:strand:+ start:21400 stop:21606 length:207 start_codon:yes stop_codon:yes gene_type:complete
VIEIIQLFIMACQIHNGSSDPHLAYKAQRDCHRELVRCGDKVYQSVVGNKKWNEEKKKYFVLKECLSK